MPKFLTIAAVAECTGLSPSTLNKLRVSGGGPPFVKLGARVVYPDTELAEWQATQPRRQSTAEYTAPGQHGGRPARPRPVSGSAA